MRIDPSGRVVIGAGNDVELEPPLSVRRVGAAFDSAADAALSPLSPPAFTCIGGAPRAGVLYRRGRRRPGRMLIAGSALVVASRRERRRCAGP